MKMQIPRHLRLAYILLLVIGNLGLLPVYSLAQVGVLETPQPGSSQSGIGVIRGWFCQPKLITIEIIGFGIVRAVYGEPRGDTQGVCGDTNNGFSLQINWNDLDDGTYTVRALADGVEFGRARVVVATFGQPYLQGVRGDFVLPSFPQGEKQTRIQWQESRQGFVLSNTETPSANGGSPRTDAKLEDPQPGTFQSGIGLVRGWVCKASRVDIEIDGRITIPAVYNQLRGDTRGVCGDGENGFSLMVNWNIVGDGTHQVRALADGQEIGSATFTVATLGLGQFPTGLAGNFTLDNFPEAGIKTQVQWQESQQNFVITGIQFPKVCDTGVSNAPCQRVDKRLIVVDPAGTGDFTQLRTAFATGRPGDTFLLKNGTYTCPECANISNSNGYLLKSENGGTRRQPVTITNYPGHTPILTTVLTIQAPWVLIEGLRFQRVPDTAVVGYYFPSLNQRARHITIRNNIFYENGAQGLYTSGVSDLLIEKNIFERNGLGPGDCSGSWPPDNFRYAHCHGIYLNNSDGQYPLLIPMRDITIRQNRFLSNAGFAWTSRSDANYVWPDTPEFEKLRGKRNENLLIENNLVVNHSINTGFLDMEYSTIRNNTIVQFDFPKPNWNWKTCFYSNHNTKNIIANNICYSVLNEPNSTLYPIYSWAKDSTIGNVWTNNAFLVSPDVVWGWGGVINGTFLAGYRGATGDTSALLVPLTTKDGAEAGWVNPQPSQATKGDFHLRPDSVLRGAGDPAHCPSVDLDGTPRVPGTCDLGAFTFR